MQAAPHRECPLRRHSPTQWSQVLRSEASHGHRALGSRSGLFKLSAASNGSRSLGTGLVDSWPASAQRTSFDTVRNGLLPLLVLVLIFQTARLSCGMASANATIMARCCGSTCPVGRSLGAPTSCYAEAPIAAEAPSAKLDVVPLQLFVSSIRNFSAMPRLLSVERLRVFEDHPLGAGRLALQCSRQI